VHLLALAIASDRKVKPDEIDEYEAVLGLLFPNEATAVEVSHRAFTEAASISLDDLPAAIVRHAVEVEPKGRVWIFRLVARVVAADGDVADIEDGLLSLLADAFDLSEDLRIATLRAAVEDDLGFADRPL
jgi:uncharacterized tellurite resistance protein B-like protein